MYKHASKRNHVYDKPKLESNHKIREVAHAFQEWKQPKRKTTFKKYHNGTPNKKYSLHYSNDGLESKFNPNKEPASIVKAREKASKLKRNLNWVVYLIHFKNVSETFVKVGITSKTVRERFSKDIDRFEMTILGQSKNLSHDAAYALEQAIIEHFQRDRKRPKILLFSGGNTECFRYNTSLIKEALLYINRS